MNLISDQLSQRSKYLQCIPGAGPSLFLFYVLPEELNEAADHLNNKHGPMDLLRRLLVVDGV